MVTTVDELPCLLAPRQPPFSLCSWGEKVYSLPMDACGIAKRGQVTAKLSFWVVRMKGETSSSWPLLRAEPSYEEQQEHPQPQVHPSSEGGRMGRNIFRSE